MTKGVHACNQEGVEGILGKDGGLVWVEERMGYDGKELRVVGI